MFLNEKERLGNIELSMQRDLPWMDAYQAHGGRWNICAGGPSLRKEIKRIRKATGVIVSVNGSHDYLLSKGVTPDYFVLTDPQEHNARFVGRARKGVIYLIAAHCHPSVFDALDGYDCRLWFPLDYELPVPVSIGGGSTVGLRAINIGHTLGYTDIHLFGFDGCVKEHHHAYPQKENDDETVKTIEYRGKEFQMTDWMIAQADNFDELMRTHHLNITAHTPGIIKHIGDYYASR